MIDKIKKHRKILVIIVIIIIAVIGGLYAKNQFSIKKSVETFHAAEDSEKNEDYQQAYELYSHVIPDDHENFENAKAKIEELEKRFTINEKVALSFEILKQVGEANTLDELKDIESNSSGSRISCTIDGIGYMIYEGSGESSQYQQAIMSKDGTYCVMKYEAKKEYGGWFSADINMINQDTSLAIFETVKTQYAMSSDLISEKLIKEYVAKVEDELK